ncbi:PucR family transcriptional regulator [Nocardioides caldifontis]|uniref:PucR family transcriptional regulator n=1 Tax=Nocardioides caldifontis TaxID=2588938 RepID=UPI0011DF8517|nr:PucR family transcriptional regulator [Nocardioides caldifontis]
MTLEQARPSAAVTVRETWGGSELDLGPRSVSPQEAELVKLVGRRLGEQVPAMTEDVVNGIVELFPRVGPPTGDVAALRSSVHDNMVTMWSMVAHGLEPSDVNPPPNALLWPRKLIRARVPLGTLMRVYYVGHANIWHRWVHPRLVELAAEGFDTTVVSARLHSLAFTYLDQAALRVAEQYHAERMELSGSEDRALQAAVRDLLAGARLTPAIERTVRFPVGERHRAWVLWLPPTAADLGPVLPSLAEGVHALLGGRSAPRLTTRHGPTEVWGWTGAPATGPLATDKLARLLGLPADADRAATVTRRLPRLAVATPDTGVDGFRDGHDEARALRAAMDRAEGLTTNVMTSEEAGLAALLVADPPNARRFARRHLGSLAASGERDATLLTTLRTFLAHAGSFQRTSAALGVHRNTVLQRIRRCEAELGRPVTSSEPELAAALLILDWLPSATSRG